MCLLSVKRDAGGTLPRPDPSGPGRKRGEDRRPSPHPGGGSSGGGEDDPTPPPKDKPKE